MRKNKINYFIFCGLITLIMIISSACSRSLGDKSVLTLDLSKHLNSQGKISSQNLANVTFIAVNISGPDMKKLVWVWDSSDHCDNDCANPPPPPNPVVLPNVKSGDARLIQVLLVTEDEATDAMEFKYGDTIKNLGSGHQGVTVTVNDMGVSTSTEGSVSGRYLLSNTGPGYTGEVIVSVPPSNNNPPMELFRLDMFAGWFNFFLLDGVNLEYKMVSNGHVMFGGPINLTSPVFTAANSVMRITSPEVWEDSNNDRSYDANQDDHDASEIHIAGFFLGGNAHPSANVYYDTTTYLSDKAYKEASMTNLVSWPGDFTIAPSNTGTMADPPVNLSAMYVNGEVLEHTEGDGVLFAGPIYNFVADGRYNVMHTNFNSGASTLTVDWKYLPGLNSAVAGMGVFYSSTGGNMEIHNGPGGGNCNNLLNQGFQKVNVPYPSETYVKSNVSAAVLGNSKIVLCPYSANGQYFKAVSESHCLGDNCGGGPVAFCDGYTSETNHAAIGGGTSADPYKICTPSQMQSLSITTGDLNKVYELMGDIDMSPYYSASGPEFKIGNSTTLFSGEFRGNGHTISNYTINTAGDYVGLFGDVAGSVHDLKLSNINITSSGSTGAIGAVAGFVTGIGSVNYVAVLSGVVNGTTQVGGLVGVNLGSIQNSYTNANVISSGIYAGGFVGRTYSGGNISNCFSSGDVTSSVGKAGGFVGSITSAASITNSFAVGDVTGNSVSTDVGLLAGVSAGGTLTNFHYDSGATPTNSGPGGILVVGTTQTSTYFHTSASGVYSSWDFVNVWQENSGNLPSLVLPVPPPPPSLNFSTESTNASNVKFSNDGLMMYLVGKANNYVYQYSLSTAFNVATASYDSVFINVSPQDINIFDIHFKSDGSKMYLVGASNDAVFQYSITTAWDLSTASYDSVSFSVGGQDLNPMSLSFSGDGSKMYILGNNTDNIFQYTLSTSWDLSTASYDSVIFSVAGQESIPLRMFFSSNGLKIYAIGLSDTIFQYNLSVAWDISSASYSGNFFDVSPEDANPQGFSFSGDGGTLHMLGLSTKTIYTYYLGTSHDIGTVQ